jgi:2-oxoisovalerate dehydrogenase E1 component beta subunit
MTIAKAADAERAQQPPKVGSNFGFADSDTARSSNNGDGEDQADRQLTYIAAISEALREEMRRDPNVLLMGEDIGGSFGGAFKVTKGFEEEFGAARVLNMPMAELGFVGAATGMALMGLRPVIEMQFADFITTAFDSIVQYAATNYYRWLGAVPWVIRAPSDGGLRSGPFHSQNPEAWFAHAPGLKVVAPATPADAKGLMIAAIRDNNPVIYFEAKPLYRSLKGYVPAGDYVVPLGKAHLARTGDDLSIITYGAQVREALAAAAQLAEEGISVEVVDLRTLKPLDTETVLASVRKTGKVLVVHSANRLLGVGAEIAALIADEAFEWLDAPVRRLGGLDVPIPFSPPLEDAYRPDAAKITTMARALAAF